MDNPDVGGYEPPEEEQSQLAAEISKRASAASDKVRQRVNEVVLPHINAVRDMADNWLYEIQNDLIILAENPDDPCGAGNYKDWTSDEVRELYSVLYGEEME